MAIRLRQGAFFDSSEFSNGGSTAVFEYNGTDWEQLGNNIYDPLRKGGCGLPMEKGSKMGILS